MGESNNYIGLVVTTALMARFGRQYGSLGLMAGGAGFKPLQKLGPELRDVTCTQRQHHVARLGFGCHGFGDLSKGRSINRALSTAVADAVRQPFAGNARNRILA